MEKHALIELRVYLKLFLYLVVFNVVFILATLVLHEAGHYFYGTAILGCDGSIVLYDPQEQGPYTSLQCDTQPDTFTLYLSSLIFMIPFALLFPLLRGFEERHFFLVVLGVAIMSTAFDIEGIAGTDVGRYVTIFVGMMVFVAGEYSVVDDMFKRFKDRIREIHSADLTGEDEK